MTKTKSLQLVRIVAVHKWYEAEKLDQIQFGYKLSRPISESFDAFIRTC